MIKLTAIAITGAVDITYEAIDAPLTELAQLIGGLKAFIANNEKRYPLLPSLKPNHTTEIVDDKGASNENL